ncbi:MAG TPA: nucleoside-diphosphate sugar epimerase/dehydratase [Lacipirellulaceae bacterium]|nr:nucleoside-diphosphate sugar epimerase/dehydratase [Lacipirellulaceae bacterium]
MINHLHKRHALQLAVSAAIFMPLFATCYYTSFLLRFAGDLDARSKYIFFTTVIWLICIKWIAFVWFRLHQGWSRFVGFDDLLVLAKAVTCGALGVTLIDTMWLTDLTIPRSIIVIDWGATLLAVGAVRAAPRLFRHDAWHLFAVSGGTRCFIVGADHPGETLLRSTRNNPLLNYHVIGFIDDRPQMLGCRIGGVPVLGACEDLPLLVGRYAIEEVLIMSGGLSGKQVRRLTEIAPQHQFRVKVLPGYEELLEERVALQPRPVVIEDLLSRKSVQLDLDSIRELIDGRTVMVTGSAGSIGSEICRQLLKLCPARIVPVDRAETGQFQLERELHALKNNCGLRSADFGLGFDNPQSEIRNPKLAVPHIDVCLADLTDRNRMSALFAETRPEIVFHAAAYKHVPLMEAHCGEAVKNIVLATRNLADLADEYGARAFVLISTDKAVNPTSVMGTCKRLAEQYVQARSSASKCRFVTVRFGNVLDSSGSVVPIFREQIARGGPVTITHRDITRYFMLIPEAAQLVLQAGAMGRGGEIFVLDMGEPVRILDLARDMIRLSGLRVGDDIEIQIVGLRPGEKLFEELYDDSERHQRTSHPKIMVAASSQRNLVEVIHGIRWLESLVDERSEIVKEALREVVAVPEVIQFVQHRAAA